MKDYHKEHNEDYKALSQEDKDIVDKIDSLLKKLSEGGREYWGTYYG